MSTLHTRSVTINSVAPTATFNAPDSVNEGSSIDISLTGASDPSSADIAAGFTYAFDCGDGLGFGPFSSSNTARCPTNDNGSRTVKGMIRDKDGATFQPAPETVNVANVAPTASGINAPNSVNAGSTFTISLTDPTDASSVDQGSLQYRFDCGDGSGYGAFGSSNSRSCPTSAPGNRTVKGQIKDKDGEVSNHYTKTVRVLPLLRITDVRVTEGNSGSKSAVFTVQLSSASQQRVTVNYTTANGTAKAPGDYTAKSGTLSFTPTETAKTISVAVKGDRLKESSETYFVRLSGAVNAAIADASGQGTIIDND